MTMALMCAQHVTRDRWRQMSPSAKQVYVRSLIGGEQAKNAKGGGGNRYSGSAGDYIRRIDEAYSRGDRRDPNFIFAGLADRR